MTNNRAVKVIISDVDSRKGFDTVNIIRNLYSFHCVLCAGRDYNIQLPLIYHQKVFPLRSKSYPLFEKDFFKILSANASINLVYLPVSEKPTRYLYNYLKRYGKPDNLFYLLPGEHVFEMTSHKGLFQTYCEKNGFPIPKSFSFSEALSSNFSFQPLIAKPYSGEGSVGIKHIDSQDKLDAISTLDQNTYLIQEKIKGTKKIAGAFFLCKNGKVINHYTHQRIRTFPENGGVTVYSRSGDNSKIISIGSKLLKSLNWNGIAMIEFMQDRDSQDWNIIELNPRLWGSVMLSAFNESRMLLHYVQKCLNAESSSESSSEPTSNKYIRWWFPFEVLSFVKGSISLKQLFQFDFKNTCYINFTYASLYASFLYMLYFTFNGKSFKRFLKKLR